MILEYYADLIAKLSIMKARFLYNKFIVACTLILTLLLHPSVVNALGLEKVESVYIGGFPVGLEIQPDGVIVEGVAPVETEFGIVTLKSKLNCGDIIRSINGLGISSVEDIRNALAATDELKVDVEVRRGTATLSIKCDLIIEDLTGEKRLGLQIRENVAGVGTVTYVTEDGCFACLGHPITLSNGSPVPCKSGNSYNCKILGYERAARGKAGELRGTFSGYSPTGKLYKNCISGVYGKFDEFEGGTKIKVGSRKEVNLGKAYILATIGDKVEKYSIEIIKASNQNSIADKSMVIRVTDKRLLESTGGIVQGMSGSPIIQNNKLIGAVTHVFISDATKGYGIYADWMLKNGKCA